MATVVSFINMKGGVGKTTLAIQIAHAADERDLRVLAIDLDPQSNLSQALLGPKEYVQHVRQNRPTILQIFEGFRPPSRAKKGPKPVRIQEAIIKEAGYWRPCTLDLIPSRLELARTLVNPGMNPRRLAEALALVDSDYDLVVIDCPPTESALTTAAYAASRYVVVPAKPEFLGAVGLPLLATSIADFRLKNPDHDLEVCGVAFNFWPTTNKLGPEARQASAEIRITATENGWPIFPTHIRFSLSYAKSAREAAPIAETSKVRWWVSAGFREFAKQFFKSIGIE